VKRDFVRCCAQYLAQSWLGFKRISTRGSHDTKSAAGLADGKVGGTELLTPVFA
jgi:hypothetical protein